MSVVASETVSISVVEVRISGIGIIPVVASEILPVVAREMVSISIVSGIGIDQPRGKEYGRCCCRTGIKIVTDRVVVVMVVVEEIATVHAINPSLYCVVPDLFLSLYVSLRSCWCSSSSSSFDRIFLSVPFRSCFSSCSSRLDPIYRPVSLSCRTVSFFLSLRVVLVLLCPPTPTDDTPTPSLWSWNQYFMC